MAIQTTSFPQPFHDDLKGQHVGNYQLIRRLGRGGFAEVYLAKHRFLGTFAAVKLLFGHMIAQHQQTFQDEAKTLATLRHPHILRLLDFGLVGEFPYFVMDYAPGGTLRQRHALGSIVPLPLVVTYVKQVASALQYTHEAKRIHRDVKPENMLLDEQGHVLLSDFGIATIAHSTTSLQTQEAIGTVYYMVPEQFHGKAREASDQYALGVVIYKATARCYGGATELLCNCHGGTSWLQNNKEMPGPSGWKGRKVWRFYMSAMSIMEISNQKT